MLVQVTSIDQLVERLKKGKFRSSADVLTRSKFHTTITPDHVFSYLSLVKQTVSDDDDIVSGPQKMSLKCPVRSHTLFFC